MNSADDEPPIEEYPVEDKPSGSKRSEVENIQAREKAISHFLNRRGHVLPAPDREEVYPLETISAKRGKNRKGNMWFYNGYFSNISIKYERLCSITFQTSRTELKIYTTYSGVYLTNFEVCSNTVLSAWYIFSIETRTKEKTDK